MISTDELFELEIKKAQYALGDKKMKKAERLQYSINGDKEGYLVASGGEKMRKGNIKDISDEEFIALVGKNWAILNKGNSDGSF